MNEITIILDEEADTMAEDEAMDRLLEWMLSVATRVASTPEAAYQAEDRKAA